MRETLDTLNATAAGPIFSFFFGLIWGSFLNVCIHRLPREESLWRKSSHCPHCEKPVHWFWNIPILSFIWLRGRCGYCQASISLQYPLVEIASGLLFLALFLNYEASLHFLAYAIFASSLLVLSVIDLQHRIIPDEVSLPGIVLGFLASFITHDISWQQSLLGIMAGGGAFFLIAFAYERITKREGLGGGDVKLLAMMGAWLGVESILIIIVISSALGSLVGIFLMLFHRRSMQTAIPFGPFLAFAGLLYLFFGGPLRSLFFPEFS